MIDDLGQKPIVLYEFLDDMRYVKGYASIVCTLEEGYLKDHNKMFFYDGEILQYMVGTNRIVKAIVDVNDFAVRKDGVEYKGEKARAQFNNDADFKQWKRSCDGTKNALNKRRICDDPALQGQFRLGTKRDADAERVQVLYRTGITIFPEVPRVRGGTGAVFATKG